MCLLFGLPSRSSAAATASTGAGRGWAYYLRSGRAAFTNDFGEALFLGGHCFTVISRNLA